ncbi:MAG: ABC transporter substrate-binding protein [Treponema sp.]|jgi:iron(III) transport system substrate-binding protein|nr:ABC transporter substrate-binding protein [Treponema sp.]
MKNFMCFTLILALATAAVFAGGSSDKGQPSGKITIYTSMYEDVIKSLDGALKKQFPQCEIEFVYGGTGQIQARVAAEQAAGKLGCDMLLVAEPSYSLELKEKKMLHRFISAQAGNLAFDYDKKGYWYPVRVSNMVLAYNPGKNNKNSVPDSFNDFAHNASVSGAVSMSNPLSSGTAMAAAAALRDKYGYGYFEALGRQNVKIESGAAALAKLETGEYKVVMVLEESVLKKRQEESSKLEVIYPADGIIIIPSTIMTIVKKWSAHNNTKSAEIITDWFLSYDGQKAIVAGWMHSVRKDFDVTPYDSIPTSQIQANSMPLNWENCFRQRGEIQAKFEDFVTHKK